MLRSGGLVVASWIGVVLAVSWLSPSNGWAQAKPATQNPTSQNSQKAATQNPASGQASTSARLTASSGQAGNPPAGANPVKPGGAVQDLVAMLGGIDPYRPVGNLSGKVQVFGSTAMDNMVHAWATEFKLFHPQVTVEVTAAGSGDAFAQLKQNPQALVMLSRPVKPEELQQVKSDAIKDPVAFVVAREALGVFVHASNPAKSISGEQLRAVFTKQSADADLKWQLLDVTGPLAQQPIRIVARSETSGTQAFLRDFVFGGMEMRVSEKAHESNGDVLGALANDPLGITICGLRANGLGVRVLPLVGRAGVPVPNDDAAVLSGQYPMTRNLTLVVDLGQKTPEAKAAHELVHFALCRSGQLAAIRAGFFPAELPTLRAGLNLLERDKFR
ncbi:MAG: substrate-binding domain-containing protein [Pirellulaceae bacterium]|nr:substrate-binding domain-containing protein [Pirellulaceae bacterium]